MSDEITVDYLNPEMSYEFGDIRIHSNTFYGVCDNAVFLGRPGTNIPIGGRCGYCRSLLSGESNCRNCGAPA